jgi:hypothetical protein
MASSGDGGEAGRGTALSAIDNGAGCPVFGGDRGCTDGGGGGGSDGPCCVVGGSAGVDSPVVRTDSGGTEDPKKRNTRSKKRNTSLERSVTPIACTSSQPMDTATLGDVTRKRGRSAGDDDLLSPGHAKNDTGKKPKEAKRRALPPAVHAKPCNDCGLPCLLSDSLECRSCEKPVHLKCLKVPVAKHVIAVEISNLLSFTCCGCRLEGKQRLAVIEAELMQLRQEFADLRHSLLSASDWPRVQGEGSGGGVDPGSGLASTDKPPGGATIAERLKAIAGSSARLGPGTEQTSGGLNYKDTVKLVKRAVVDVTRRKRNIVVTGLPETGNVESDFESFTTVCESNLYMKLRSKVVSVKRLGKPDSKEARLRRMLVTFDCDATASEVLARGREFRQSSDPYIAHSLFINPDLSPDEEFEAYERRKMRRAKVAVATNDLPAADGSSYSRPIPTVSGLRTFHRSHPTRAAGIPHSASPTVVKAVVSASGGGAGRPI